MAGKFGVSVEMWGRGERQGREGTPGRTVLTKMYMHPPDEGAHGDMEGRCGGYHCTQRASMSCIT